nr:hypothetical protein [Tanacetum cinerariifolium]
MDQKIRTFTEREITSKRKLENTSTSTQNQQQQPNKRQNTGRVYTTASGERKEYAGTLPLCNKYHGNQAGGTGAHGMVHALEGGETNQDLNDVEDDINA